MSSVTPAATPAISRALRPDLVSRSAAPAAISGGEDVDRITGSVSARFRVPRSGRGIPSAIQRSISANSVSTSASWETLRSTSPCA